VIGRPSALMLTGGNAADSPVASHLLTGLKGVRYLLADEGYDANQFAKAAPPIRDRLSDPGPLPSYAPDLV
jgi:transposase